jgi:hypothetical protein
MNRTFTSLLVSLVFPISLTAFVGCKKDEPPPPLPPAAAPAPEPSPVLAIEPVPDVVPDAGAPVAAKRVGGAAAPAGNLQACCNALAQNAASAPEPNATYMKQAAATCGVLAAQGKDKGTIVAILAGVLKGAGMPTQCK